MGTKKRVKRKGKKLLGRLFFVGGLVLAGRYLYEKLNSSPEAAPTSTYSVESDAGPQPSAKRIPLTDTPTKAPGKGDDLTEIKGIGPTYAKRLQAAGITTFKQLGESAPAKLAEIAQLREWQAADTESWVAQAKAQA